MVLSVVTGVEAKAKLKGKTHVIHIAISITIDPPSKLG